MRTLADSLRRLTVTCIGTFSFQLNQADRDGYVSVRYKSYTFTRSVFELDHLKYGDV